MVDDGGEGREGGEWESPQKQLMFCLVEVCQLFVNSLETNDLCMCVLW